MESRLQRQGSHFNWPCPVYYEDTDGQGFLYHSRCMNYFERARTEWLRSLGIAQSKLLSIRQGFVVAKAQLTYHRPAFLDDQLVASVYLTGFRKTNLTITQLLLRPSGLSSSEQLEAEPIVSGEFQIAFVHLEKLKPMAMSADILESLRAVLDS